MRNTQTERPRAGIGKFSERKSTKRHAENKMRQGRYLIFLYTHTLPYCSPCHSCRGKSVMTSSFINPYADFSSIPFIAIQIINAVLRFPSCSHCDHPNPSTSPIRRKKDVGSRWRAVSSKQILQILPSYSVR